MDATGRPYALVMQKGSVAPYALKPAKASAARTPCTPRVPPRSTQPDALPSRRDALARVIARTPLDSTVVLASTGFCGRELYALDDRSNQLYMVGSMGCLTPFALGLALVRPDLRVIALDGDGAALMRMSAFATIGAYGPPNLTHVLLDNGAHDSTGGQATVSGNLSFAGVAAACGYASAIEGDSVDMLDELLATPELDGTRLGSHFARLSIRAGTPDGLPRPTITPVDVKLRLMRHIGSDQGVADAAA